MMAGPSNDKFSRSEVCSDDPPPLSITLKKARDLPNETKHWSEVDRPVDILLLTVEDCELLACYHYLKDSFSSYEKSIGYVYFGKMSEDKYGSLKVALMRCSKQSLYPGGSQTTTKNAVTLLKPKATFLVGFCYSLNPDKAQLGDVVISSKLTTDFHKTPVSSYIGNLVRSAAYGWKAPLEYPETREVNVCDGEILSCSDLIDAKQQCQSYPGAIAAEIEGKGLFAAAHEMKMEWLVVKGVCAFVHGVASTNDSWKTFACVMAASVVSYMLRNSLVFEDWPHYRGDELDIKVEVDNMKLKEQNTQTGMLATESDRYQEVQQPRASAPSAASESVSCPQTEDLKARGEEIFQSIVRNYLQTTPPQSSEERNKFKEYLKAMRLIITGVSLGCLLITVKCESLMILEKLWTDYSSGHLGEVVQNCFVTEKILKELNLAELRLKTTMDIEEYNACKMLFEKDAFRGALSSEFHSTSSTSESPQIKEQWGKSEQKTTIMERAKLGEQESSKPTNSCEKGEFQVEQTEENIQAANKRGSSEGTVLCQITEKAKILASRGPQQRTVETMAEPTSFSLGTGHDLVPNERIDPPSQPTENLSALSNCYSRAGYSVLVSNGSLCESTPEMGLVEMENGAAFHIKVQNNNYYAVEVDVTFSGKFLGIWTLEAQQSYPLVIDGSSWESGKLKYFSKPNETEYEMLDSNGKIELEFKPEAMVLIAKHSRLQKRHEVLLTDFKLATVKDLREEMNRTLWDQLRCITCLIKDGEVLDEWQFIRSYSLKNGDIIEVLTCEEPILIESSFRDPFTLWVDPHHDSIESVRGTVASKMNVKDLSFLLDEKHIARRGPLTKIFLQSRKPVLKAIKARDVHINVTVHLPSEEAKRVRVSQFATVDELMRDLNIPTSGALLRVNDEEIQDSTGLKELLDLGIKNGSEVTVTFATEGRSLSSYRNPSHESTQEEWADSESPSPSSHNFDCSAEFNPLQYIPEEMYGISGHFNNLEWIEEDKSFCGCYQLDNRRKRFTKDKLKSVTLVVQLCSKRSVTQMLHSYEPPVHFDST